MDQKLIEFLELNKLFEDNGILFETVEGEKWFDFSSNKIVKK